jgi:hypothetical protein
LQCILGFGTTDQILGQWNNELMDRITNGSVFGRYGYDFGSTDLFLEETEPIRFWMKQIRLWKKRISFLMNGSDFGGTKLFCNSITLATLLYNY